jgi:hypothetical protein
MFGVKGRGGYRKSIGSEIYMKLVRSTSELIKSVDFKVRSRKKASYFTRKCKMPFHELMSYTLNSYNCSIRSGLSHFFPLVEKKISP